MLRNSGAVIFALVVLAAAFGLAGCATDDPEYNAFYRNGWLWPKSMDNDRGQIHGSGTRDSVQNPVRYSRW